MATGTGYLSQAAEGQRKPATVQPSGIVQAETNTARLWGELAQTAGQIGDGFAAVAMKERKQALAGYLSEQELGARRKQVELREQHRYDPDGFDKAWQEYSDGVLSTMEPSLVPEGREILGREGLSALTDLTRERANRDEGLRRQSTISAMELAEQDVLAIAASGGTAEDVMGRMVEYDAKGMAAVGLGFMADEERLRRRQSVVSQAAGEALTVQVRAAYQAGGVEAARSLIDGAFIAGQENGLTATDARVYKNRADALIHGLESERKAELREARAAVRELRLDAKADAREMMQGFNQGAAPRAERVEELARRLDMAGAPREAQDLRIRAASAAYINDFARRPPMAQEQLLVEARTALDKGEIEPWLVQEMEKAANRTRTGLQQDPMGYAQEIDAVKLPPIDWTAPPDQFASMMAARRKAATVVEEWYGLAPTSPLTKAETEAFKNTWDRADSAARANILGRLASSMSADQLGATLVKVANDRPVLAWAGGLYKRNAEVAISIVRGEALVEADKTRRPKPEDVDKAINDYLGGAMSLMGRAREAVRQAAIARYADLAASSGSLGDFDADFFDQALLDVTGGVTTWNRRKLVLPPGVNEDRFGSLMDSLTDADLVGAVTAKNTKVRAADLRKLGKLVDFGAGKYLVDLGAGYVLGENNQPFVLDLGRIAAARPPQPRQRSAVPDAYITGGVASQYGTTIQGR